MLRVKFRFSLLDGPEAASLLALLTQASKTEATIDVACLTRIPLNEPVDMVDRYTVQLPPARLKWFA